MNKFIKIFILGVLILGVVACSKDYLDVEPQTTLLDQNFYKTEADFEMALIGCYDGWQRTTSNGSFSFYCASEVMSDECFGGTGFADPRNYAAVDRFDISQSPSDANIFNSLWVDYYAGVFRCNTLLQKLAAGGVEWESTSDSINNIISNRIEGETRVIRALLYFDMVRLWGNIPLLTVPTTDNIPQADPTDVYQVIAEDLMFAAENIPADAYPKSNSAKNDGRITRYAAKALLARVYLYYTGYEDGAYDPEVVTKAEVLDGLEDVVANTEFGLISDYKNLWEPASSTPVQDEYAFTSTYAGRGNKETILAQKFNDTQDYNGNLDGNRWLVMMGIRNLNASPYGKGWGACTVHPKMWTAFEASDTRRQASIINLETEGITSNTDYEASVKDQREYTGYTVKKYTPMSYYDGTTYTQQGAGDFQSSQSEDFVVMRYADVLLMAAELGSPNAQSYFNQVRNRAFGGNAPAKVATKEAIMQERMYEFAFEGQRYWDLLRQGVSTAADVIADNVSVLSGNAPDEVVILSNNIIEKKGLSQIPKTQITAQNNVLIQNHGWE